MLISSVFYFDCYFVPNSLITYVQMTTFGASFMLLRFLGSDVIVTNDPNARVNCNTRKGLL